MGLKPDWWIQQQSERYGMIHPYVAGKQRNGMVSFGTSSYGYDIRWAEETYIFTAWPGAVLDPKQFDERVLRRAEVIDGPVGRYVVLPPYSFALGKSVEEFYIPDNVLTICVGKSTYARLGAILNVTPFEPGWRGHATLELTNSTPLALAVYVNEGIGQVLFFEGDDRPRNAYGEGTYQDQPNAVVPARVSERDVSEREVE